MEEQSALSRSIVSSIIHPKQISRILIPKIPFECKLLIIMLKKDESYLLLSFAQDRFRRMCADVLVEETVSFNMGKGLLRDVIK